MDIECMWVQGAAGNPTSTGLKPALERPQRGTAAFAMKDQPGGEI